MTHLPTTIKEVRARGWEELDVIIFTGDAYVDHPSFGAAVIGRVLERAGYRVAIVPQPNWQDDLRDFTKLGAPRLFFGVTAGAMDSMVNHYTANKRLRSDDAYTAGGTAGRRPDRAVTVYSRILKKLYPHIPVVAAGIEASLRRLTHYDYWDDKLHPSILVDSGADVVAYGMGERVVLDIAKALHGGFNMHLLRKIPQIAYLVNKAPLSPTYNNHHSEPPQAACSLPLYSREVASGECVMEHRGMKRLPPGMAASRCDFDEQSRPNRSKILLAPPLSSRSERSLVTRHSEPASAGVESPATKQILLHSFEACTADPEKFGENFVTIETESNRLEQITTLVEPVGDRFVVVNPPYPLATTEQTDAAFDLPFTRLPHPRYNGKGQIPAFEMIKFSVNIHRGCFGGCSFCTISAHQGKFITARSERSILKEVDSVTQMPDFKGYVSDLGGPSANMYGMRGRDEGLCRRCTRPSCAFPALCRNLDNSHARLLKLMQAARARTGIKKIFIGSGIRYDLFEGATGGATGGHKTGGVGQISPPTTPSTVGDYLREVVTHHTSGRLKVAPEHTEPHVLNLMRKPPFVLFEQLNRDFCNMTDKYQLIPYFISSHPGCTERDMKRLSEKTRGIRTEQVQDLTPTPMTLSSVMFHTGRNPYTGEKLYVAKSPKDKLKQKSWFFKTK